MGASAASRETEARLSELRRRLTAADLEGAVQTLLCQGEDPGGGIDAYRLVRHLLGEPALPDVETVWVYDQLKPLLRAAFGQLPSLYTFEGD